MADRPAYGPIAGGILVVLAVAGFTAYRAFDADRWFAPGTLTAPSSAPPEQDVSSGVEVTVRVTAGTVEVRRQQGPWSPAKPGDRLAANDAVRSDDAALADLQIGEHTKISLTERSEVLVQEVGETEHRLRLQRGRLDIDHRSEGPHVIRIESANGDAVAETSEAQFSVLDTGFAFAVAAESGRVNLEAAGASVQITAGQQSVAARGRTPEAAKPVSVALLLKLARSGSPEIRDECITVIGQTDTGAEITVDGVPILIDRAGRFRHRVPRAPGKQNAVVTVRDARGRSRTQEVPCQPALQVEQAPDVELKLRSWGADE